MRRHQRNELHNIAIGGDINELSISGHVEHEPKLREDNDREHVCDFVLTHTTTGPSGHWELQRYNVQAHGQLGEHYATNWQPSQTTVINGRLEHHIRDTLTSPVPNPSIIAHTIDTTLGPHPHRIA